MKSKVLNKSKVLTKDGYYVLSYVKSLVEYQLEKPTYTYGKYAGSSYIYFNDVKRLDTVVMPKDIIQQIKQTIESKELEV